MTRRLAPLITVVLAACAAGASAPRAPAHGPLVLELFQSQGCSSCPPANANLAAVADRPGVIALNFAVTYWDDLGWKDTFAKPAFTLRQRAYAHGLGQGDVYTPEMVVDGRKAGAGMGAGEFAGLIRYGAQTSLSGPPVRFDGAAVRIGAGGAPPRPDDVWLVRFDPRLIDVQVAAGENAGKTLPHKNIVRQLARLGAWSGPAKVFALPPSTDAALRTAILVQAPSGGPIVAAARD